MIKVWLALFALQISAAAPVNNFILGDEANFIISPNYPDQYSNNEKKSYTVHVREGYFIHVDMLVFQTEECCDFVYVYDSDTVLMNTFSGNATGKSFETTGSSLTVLFETDLTNTMAGFFMHYTAVPLSGKFEPSYLCPTIVTGSMFPYGVITTPGFPSNYSNAITCNNPITAAPGQRIQLTFFLLDTEECCDIVEVYDGTTKTGTPIARLSGKTPTSNVITSTSPGILVSFTSDLTNTFQGFSAAYRILAAD